MISPDKDHRMTRLPLMNSPNKTVLIVLSYLIFVKVLGPAWMRRRKPYDLRKLMIVYNFTLVAASTWLFHKFGKHGWYSKYSWKCANFDLSEDEDALGMVYACWYFYLSKLVELADTVFFVLRKKYSQISALHLIHHAAVPLTAWYAITHAASGYNTLFGFINTFVHIWMYLYYGLAALGPWIQKYLWWKKYLTTLQMIQFCIVTVCMTLVCLTPGCRVSVHLVAVSLGQALFFFVLFLNFYRNSYKKRTIDLSQNGSNLSDSKSHENGIGTDSKYKSSNDKYVHCD